MVLLLDSSAWPAIAALGSLVVAVIAAVMMLRQNSLAAQQTVVAYIQLKVDFEHRVIDRGQNLIQYLHETLGVSSTDPTHKRKREEMALQFLLTVGYYCFLLLHFNNKGLVNPRTFQDDIGFYIQMAYTMPDTKPLADKFPNVKKAKVTLFREFLKNPPTA